MSEARARGSNRYVWIASISLAVMLGGAIFVVAFWPRIELAYHRHYFRKGSPEQQGRALMRICERRLRKGMDRVEVEDILGEKLEKRFDARLEIPTGATTWVFEPRTQAIQGREGTVLFVGLIIGREEEDLQEIFVQYVGEPERGLQWKYLFGTPASYGPPKPERLPSPPAM